MSDRVLYLFICGAGPASRITDMVRAAGISDTYALNQLAELTGLGVPIVVLPFVNQALAANQVFARSVDELRQGGIRVLYGPGEFEPHPPRTGGQVLDTYPWGLALTALNEQMTDETGREGR